MTPTKRRTPARRTRSRRSRLAACAATTPLLLLAACSSGSTSSSGPPASSALSGEQAANGTRTQVAREYWTVLAAIYSDVDPAPGATGSFRACQSADQVAYSIDNDIASAGGRLSPGPFIAKIQQTLVSHGWGQFASGQGGTVSTKDGYQVRLRQITGSLSMEADLTLTGPCVTVGNSFASAAPHMTLNDDYPDSEVSASPLPTAPLPTP